MIKLLKSLFFLLIKGALTIEQDFCPSCGSNETRKNGWKGRQPLFTDKSWILPTNLLLRLSTPSRYYSQWEKEERM